MEFDLILEADVTARQVGELAALAENYGFRGLWTQNYSSSRDAFICLVPAALATRRILLGPVVVSPYEMHPIKIANSLMTLNELSGGRAMIVIGAGGEWPRIMGVGHGKRITGCGEAIEIVRGATAGGVLNFDGQVYKARNYRSLWAQGQRRPLVYAVQRHELFRTKATRTFPHPGGGDPVHDSMGGSWDGAPAHDGGGHGDRGIARTRGREARDRAAARRGREGGALPVEGRGRGAWRSRRGRPTGSRRRLRKCAPG